MANSPHEESPADPGPDHAVAARIPMSHRTRIKFVSKNPIEHAQFTELPNRHPDMEFVLDAGAREYDWFVVYDDLPRHGGERFPLSREVLACPAPNTILLTYEPSSVKFYGEDYVNQFAHVLTSHDRAALSHPRRHDAPPVGKWYYGEVADALRHVLPPEKDAQACLFLSDKRMSHTLHRKRFGFQETLTRLLPALDVYGRGIRYVEKKAQCLDRYRYTIAMENHIGPHHWTEKLSDSFLGYCLPFYCGCPNAAAYFPEESFIPIDIDDPHAAADTIRESMERNEYERRLPAIIEARRRVIEEYNLVNLIGDTIVGSIGEGHASKFPDGVRAVQIHSRRSVIRRRPTALLRYALGKFRARRRASG